MVDPIMIETLKEKFEALQPLMSERLRRSWAATEAKALGYGGYCRRHPRDRSFA
jgi:hypothetical protein